MSEVTREKDTEKVKAIQKLPAAKNVQELCQVLEMINYQGKFLPNLLHVVSPMSELIKDECTWNWSHHQQEAFDKVKAMITTASVLAFYDMQTLVAID